jgi:translocator protein
MDKVISLFFFIALVLLVLLSGGWATGLSPEGWIAKFSDIFWGDPTWLIPPSWLLVYGLVAVSGWLVWISTDSLDVIFPMIVYAVQLVLNASWWWIYFVLEDPMLAITTLTLLSCLILFNIIVFWFYYKWAAVLLVPYFSWVVYATSLNWALIIYG